MILIHSPSLVDDDSDDDDHSSAKCRLATEELEKVIIATFADEERSRTGLRVALKQNGRFLHEFLDLRRPAFGPRDVADHLFAVRSIVDLFLSAVDLEEEQLFRSLLRWILDSGVTRDAALVKVAGCVNNPKDRSDSVLREEEQPKRTSGAAASSAAPASSSAGGKSSIQSCLLRTLSEETEYRALQTAIRFSSAGGDGGRRRSGVWHGGEAETPSTTSQSSLAKVFPAVHKSIKLQADAFLQPTGVAVCGLRRLDDTQVRDRAALLRRGLLSEQEPCSVARELELHRARLDFLPRNKVVVVSSTAHLGRHVWRHASCLGLLYCAQEARYLQYVPKYVARELVPVLPPNWGVVVAGEKMSAARGKEDSAPREEDEEADSALKRRKIEQRKNTREDFSQNRMQSQDLSFQVMDPVRARLAEGGGGLTKEVVTRFLNLLSLRRSRTAAMCVARMKNPRKSLGTMCSYPGSGNPPKCCRLHSAKGNTSEDFRILGVQDCGRQLPSAILHSEDPEILRSVAFCTVQTAALRRISGSWVRTHSPERFTRIFHPGDTHSGSARSSK